MKSVKLLIDMAREKCQSDADLARRIGVSRQDMHSLRSGDRPVSPELAAALCDVLELPGEEAREWVAIAMIENPKNAAKRSLLERALFACWVLGVGSLCTLLLGAPGTAWSAAPATTHTTNALHERNVQQNDCRASFAPWHLLALRARSAWATLREYFARVLPGSHAAIAAAGFPVCRSLC
jgi:DNA-binding XRE family transcriptional regulator